VFRRGVPALTVLLAASALAFPAGASALVKGFWGPSDRDSMTRVYKNLGVKLYQTQLRWAEIAPNRPANPRNPSDPAYRWPKSVDDAVLNAKLCLCGMNVGLMVLSSPNWANGNRGYWGAPNPGAYANFMYAASKKYPDVRLWMIWGEPARKANWQPLTPQSEKDANAGKPLTSAQKKAPRAYAAVLDAAYGALKQANGQNKVIGGNTFSWGSIRPVQFVKNMRFGSNNAKPRVDMYGHNPFTNRKPNLANKPYCGTEKAGCADYSDLDWFNRVVDSNLGRPGHSHVQLFLSEWTVPTRPRDSEFPFYVSPATQAQWIAAGFRVAKAVNAYAFGWIHLYDEPPYPNRRSISGGLVDHKGVGKPGYYAFQKG
jgi:hypothetical protein